jgi:ABC-type multidrug transport system permease subunit
MPWIFYALGAVLPATYYIDALRAIILRGADLVDFAQDLGVLAFMGLALFSLCAAQFRKKIA